jgi:hypothetical protein
MCLLRRKKRDSAKREAEKLSQRLRIPSTNARSIVVYAPELYNECFIIVAIPVGDTQKEVVEAYGTKFKDFHFTPVVAKIGSSTCICLTFRFLAVKPNECRRVLIYAKMLAKWATKAFGMNAYVSSVKSLREARARFGIK